jgi:hypothetical protein
VEKCRYTFREVGAGAYAVAQGLIHRLTCQRLFAYGGAALLFHGLNRGDKHNVRGVFLHADLHLAPSSWFTPLLLSE